MPLLRHSDSGHQSASFRLCDSMPDAFVASSATEIIYRLKVMALVLLVPSDRSVIAVIKVGIHPSDAILDDRTRLPSAIIVATPAGQVPVTPLRAPAFYQPLRGTNRRCTGWQWGWSQNENPLKEGDKPIYSNPNSLLSSAKQIFHEWHGCIPLQVRLVKNWAQTSRSVPSSVQRF